MKICRINFDANNYQSFLPKDTSIWQTNILNNDCQSKKGLWKNIEFYILQPNLKQGNFFGGIPGSIIMDEKAKNILSYFWEASGELLTFTYQNKNYYLFNCLNCYKLLDEENTKWVYGKTTNKRIRIANYVFYKDRITETPLYKIPQTIKTEILTTEGLKDCTDEFIFQVKKEKLNGLIFEELWSV